MNKEEIFCCEDFKKLHWKYQVTEHKIENKKIIFGLRVAKTWNGIFLTKEITFCPFCGVNLIDHANN